MLDTIPVCASPPGKRPINSIAKRISLSVILPRFIISPASMKNGIASRGRLPIPLKIACDTAIVAIGVPVLSERTRRLNTPVISSDTYIGIPARMNTNVKTTRSPIIIFIYAAISITPHSVQGHQRLFSLRLGNTRKSSARIRSVSTCSNTFCGL